MSIKGKKILLIATAFFGYEREIYNKLTEEGAIVDYYNERAVKSAFSRALLKISPKFFTIKTHCYYKNIIKLNAEKNYDYVFCNGATTIDKKVMKMLKQKFKNAKYILYWADSVKGKKRYENVFEEFNKVITFDRKDYLYYKEEVGLENVFFRPLYFLDCYRANQEAKNIEYDLCFIGTIHSDRYKILKEIQRISNANNLKMFIYPYLQSKFIYWYYRIIDREFRNTKCSDFKYDKISSKQIADVVNKSIAIIDAQYPKNSGLTMRTIEMLGMKKKIITTNKDIVNYDFYRENNIQVIDRQNIELNVDLLRNKYEDIPNDVYERYSLDSWLEDIFM